MNVYICVECGQNPAFRPSKICADCEAEAQALLCDAGAGGVYTDNYFSLEPVVGHDPTTFGLRNRRSTN